MAPVSLYGTKKPATEADLKKLNEDLRKRFGECDWTLLNMRIALANCSLIRKDNHVRKLVDLYVLAEKFNNENMQNKVVDTIQDSFFEYGTVFGPSLLEVVFCTTKPNSPLRDLAVAANLIHLDRGCTALRHELMRVCVMCPDFLPHMLKWVSRNFAMLGRRATEGFNNRKPDEGFSMLNRAKLCPCHFHKHNKAGAHKEHDKCAVPFNTCGHTDNDDEMDGFSMADLLGLSLGIDEPAGHATH